MRTKCLKAEKSVRAANKYSAEIYTKKMKEYRAKKQKNKKKNKKKQKKTPRMRTEKVIEKQLNTSDL